MFYPNKISARIPLFPSNLQNPQAQIHLTQYPNPPFNPNGVTTGKWHLKQWQSCTFTAKRWYTRDPDTISFIFFTASIKTLAIRQNNGQIWRNRSWQYAKLTRKSKGNRGQYESLSRPVLTLPYEFQQWQVTRFRLCSLRWCHIDFQGHKMNQSRRSPLLYFRFYKKNGFPV